MNVMTGEEEAVKILTDLSANAVEIKTKIKEGNVGESAKLVGERVALIEALRELRNSKVSLANSDIIDEMNLLVKNMEKDVSEAIGGINVKLSALLRELAKMKGAKKITAYKIQGGRYGY